MTSKTLPYGNHFRRLPLLATKSCSAPKSGSTKKSPIRKAPPQTDIARIAPVMSPIAGRHPLPAADTLQAICKKYAPKLPKQI